jgi:hypothetical protein
LLACRLHSLPEQAELLEAGRPLLVALGQPHQSPHEPEAASAKLGLFSACGQRGKQFVLRQVDLVAFFEGFLLAGQQVGVGDDQIGELGLD